MFSLLSDCGDMGDRLSATIVVEKLILLAISRGAGLDLNSSLATARGRSKGAAAGALDIDPSVREAAVEDTKRFLSCALGQLSILKDSLEAQIAMSGTGRSGGEGHAQGLAFVNEQLRAVWATALRVQESLWIDLAAASATGQKEGDADIALGTFEDDLISSSVLGGLAHECKRAVGGSQLRGDIYPESRQSPHPHSEGVVGVDVESIIEAANFRDNPHKQRIAHLIRGCFTVNS
jgi:hypothetical protein